MKVSHSDLQMIYNALYQSKSDGEFLVHKLTAPPSSPQWKTFLQKLLIAMGGLQFLAGVIFFFAYNWENLHRFGKLGIVASLIVISALGALTFTQNKLIFKSSLISLGVLTGSLLALWGQTYQTGADPYLLFLLWALLIIPITIVARSVYLWTLVVLLFNIAVILHGDQVLGLYLNSISALLLILLNILAIGQFERLHNVGQSRWFVSLFAIIPLSYLTIGAISAIFSSTSSLLLLLCILTSGTIAWFYFAFVRSLEQITLALLSSIAILFAYIIKNMSIQNEGHFLLAGIILIFIVTAAIAVLMKIKRYWEKSDEK